MLLPKPPPRSQRQTEERLKLAAGGLQLLTLAIAAAGFIGPYFHAGPGAAATPSALAAVCAGIAEGAAFLVLRYIPAHAVPPSSQEMPRA